MSAMALFDQAMTDFPIPLLWGGELEAVEIQPLRKASEHVSEVAGAEGAWILKGWVSGEDIDADGQIVEQDGIDWSAFDRNPIFTDGHPAMPETVVGHALVRKAGIMPNGKKGTWMECQLLKGNPDTDGENVARAAKLWQRHRTLCKGPNRRGLGFSVEGWAKDIDGIRIRKSVVTSVAIDIMPKNPMAFALPIMAALGSPSGGQFQAFMKALSLAANPRARDVLRFTDGIPLEHIAALRLLSKNPGGTLNEALRWSKNTGVLQ